MINLKFNDRPYVRVDVEATKVEPDCSNSRHTMYKNLNYFIFEGIKVYREFHTHLICMHTIDISN